MPRKQKIGDTSAVRGDDANQDLCGWCGDGGELICCEGCPAAYHRECVNVKEIPLGEWYCGPCLRARRLGIPRRSIEGEIDDVLEEGVCHICGGSSEDTFQPCTCQLTVSSSTARPNKTYIDEGKVTGAYIHVGSRYQADIPALLTSPPFPSPSAPPPASPSASPQILPSPISSAAIASLSNPPRSCSSSSPSPMLVCQESSSPEPVAVPMQKQADTDADAGAGASSAKSKPKPSTASSYDAPILLFDPRQALTPSYYTLDHFLSLVRRIGLELDEDSDSSSDIAMYADPPFQN